MSSTSVLRVSWYYTATTVTSIGYGDITPQNADERLVASAVMILSQLYFAKALGKKGEIDRFLHGFRWFDMVAVGLFISLKLKCLEGIQLKLPI